MPRERTNPLPLGLHPRARPMDCVSAVLLDDPRVAELSDRARWALTVAVIEWPSDGGWFFVRVETWAKRARMPRRKIERAIRELLVVGVLEAWSDPSRGWQQPNLWRLAAHPDEREIVPIPPRPRDESERSAYAPKPTPEPERRLDGEYRERARRKREAAK